VFQFPTVRAKTGRIQHLNSVLVLGLEIRWHQLIAHPDPAGKIQRQVSVLSVSELILDKVVLHFQLGNERDRTEYNFFVSHLLLG